MVTVNHNYLKLPGSYLFSTIGKKVKAYKEANPQANVISLGIGDVTQPLAPAIIEALHKSVDEMGDAATFHGYAPDLGYEFLRSAIAKNDYKDRGCDIEADEIFVSDGAKSDSGNIQEIFGQMCIRDSWNAGSKKKRRNQSPDQKKNRIISRMLNVFLWKKTR